MFVETPPKIKDIFGRQSVENLVSKDPNKRESSQIKENPKIKKIILFFSLSKLLQFVNQRKGFWEKNKLCSEAQKIETSMMKMRFI